MIVTSPWVVVPTYNEKDNITRLIDDLFALKVPNLSVLIVDDNSPDKTAAAALAKQGQYSNLHVVVREKKAGLGRAYLHGFRYALDHRADAVIQMDADFSHDPSDVPRLLTALQGADVALGSRYSHGISVINWPLRRLLISIAGNLYARLITGMPFRDGTSGFKAWRAAALRAIDFTQVEADGYGFQIVMTYRAWRKQQKIVEVPIIFTERREGQSKMSRGIIWEALWIVWRLRLFG